MDKEKMFLQIIKSKSTIISTHRIVKPENEKEYNQFLQFVSKYMVEACDEIIKILGAKEGE